MADCNNCHEQFNGTPWTYDFVTGARVHVDCAAAAPPKPNLGFSDVGSSALPPAPIGAVQHLMKPHRSQRDDATKQISKRKPNSKNRQRRARKAHEKANSKRGSRAVVVAKFPAQCAQCGLRVSMGEKIMNIGSGWVHQACGRRS